MRFKKSISDPKTIYNTLRVDGWQGGSYHENHSQRSTSYWGAPAELAVYYSEKQIEIFVMSNTSLAIPGLQSLLNSNGSTRAIRYFDLYAV